eukprot:7138539-Pyramimonas_sp.AAC.1
MFPPPRRLEVNKKTGAVRTLALNNMSEAMMVDESGEANGKMVKVKVDYSQQVGLHAAIKPLLSRSTTGEFNSPPISSRTILGHSHQALVKPLYHWRIQFSP